MYMNDYYNSKNVDNSHSLIFANFLTKNLPGALALATFLMFIFIPVKWLTTDACQVNGTKHGSDEYIVGSYITFP